MIETQVLMDCNISGYTGQRDSMESHTQKYAVTLDVGDIVQLAELGSSVCRTIRFSRDDLMAAIEFLSK